MKYHSTKMYMGCVIKAQNILGLALRHTSEELGRILNWFRGQSENGREEKVSVPAEIRTLGHFTSRNVRYYFLLLAFVPNVCISVRILSRFFSEGLLVLSPPSHPPSRLLPFVLFKASPAPLERRNMTDVLCMCIICISVCILNCCYVSAFHKSTCICYSHSQKNCKLWLLFLILWLNFRSTENIKSLCQ